MDKSYVEQKEYSLTNSEDKRKEKADKEDILLLKRFKNGDDSAFDQIYMRWFTPIYTLLKRITNSAPDAEDITQEVFFILWRNRNIIDTAKGVKAYVFSTARHQAFDLFRKQKAANNYIANESLFNDIGEDPQKIIETKELELLVEYAIVTMPKQRRDIFMLNYKEGLSPAEISKRTNVAPHKVSDQLYQARKHLKEILTVYVVIMILELLS